MLEQNIILLLICCACLWDLKRGMRRTTTSFYLQLLKDFSSIQNDDEKWTQGVHAVRKSYSDRFVF